ncbi:hypothetical protein GGG16DRAFT_113838 [Schizophyllum commune]
MPRSPSHTSQDSAFTLVAPEDPCDSLPRSKTEPCECVNTLLRDVKDAAEIVVGREPSSWSMFFIEAVEDLSTPIESINRLGAALDRLWLVLWENLEQTSSDEGRVGSPIWQESDIAAGKPFPGSNVIHKRPQYAGSAPSVAAFIPNIQALLVLLATEPHILHTLIALEPHYIHRLSPLDNLLDRKAPLDEDSLLEIFSGVRSVVHGAKSTWEDYGKKFCTPSGFWDRLCWWMCTHYRIIFLMIFIISSAILIVTISLSYGLMFYILLLCISTALEGIAFLLDNKITASGSTYNMQRDLSEAICSISDDMDNLLDALDDPLKVLTKIAGARSVSGAKFTVEARTQMSLSILGFMQNFTISAGDRLRGECRTIRSSLDNVLKERQEAKEEPWIHQVWHSFTDHPRLPASREWLFKQYY